MCNRLRYELKGDECMTYFEGPSVESDPTACFVVERREGIDRYALPSRPYFYRFSTFDFASLIHRDSSITYRNENKNIEQRL